MTAFLWTMLGLFGFITASNFIRLAVRDVDPDERAMTAVSVCLSLAFAIWAGLLLVSRAQP